MSAPPTSKPLLLQLLGNYQLNQWTILLSPTWFDLPIEEWTRKTRQASDRCRLRVALNDMMMNVKKDRDDGLTGSREGKEPSEGDPMT
ncbi:hypothetical protein Q9L58_010236 [Maublancomyces gigas]|uniref:Uncharacterized protein n=1 Tax=Discina gigas TaxID=1032678 RepID=A0ABR3G4N7_9PEZI